jgi:endonuclease YncB( thermonuclease family)
MQRAWTVRQLYLATVLRCPDGDTIVVSWHYRNLEYRGPHRVRLSRIDAPEMRPFPSQAAVTAKHFLEHLVDGKEVEIIPRRSWPDPYGRIIADVRCNGKDVSTELLAAGVVCPYSPLLRSAARTRTKAGNPNSAIPRTKFTNAPGATSGLPISTPSMHTTTPGTIAKLPNHETPLG